MSTTYIHPLGRNQRAILGSLRRLGPYHRGCGWQWASHKQTVRLLDSLVRRGLVEIVTRTIDPLIREPYQTSEYRLTPAGEQELAS